MPLSQPASEHESEPGAEDTHILEASVSVLIRDLQTEITTALQDDLAETKATVPSLSERFAVVTRRISSPYQDVYSLGGICDATNTLVCGLSEVRHQTSAAPTHTLLWVHTQMGSSSQLPTSSPVTPTPLLAGGKPIHSFVQKACQTPEVS